jgi:chromosome segregation ATPase
MTEKPQMIHVGIETEADYDALETKYELLNSQMSTLEKSKAQIEMKVTQLEGIISNQQDTLIQKEELWAIEKSSLEEVLQQASSRTEETNKSTEQLDKLAKEKDDLDCQLKLSQKELDKLYERIAEQEIQMRQWKLQAESSSGSGEAENQAKFKDYEAKLEDLKKDLEEANAKSASLERQAAETIQLNDGLNEKYLALLKRNKKLEAVVMKLHKQLEAGGKSVSHEDKGSENAVDSPKPQQSPAAKESPSNVNTNTVTTNTGQKPLVSILKKGTKRFAPMDASDVNTKSAERDATALKESASQNVVSGPRTAVGSRKMRRIIPETSKENDSRQKQECNQQ